MAQERKSSRLLKLSGLALGLGLLSSAYAQIDPDPTIYDAVQNGASSNGGQVQANNNPLGGSINVVNESQLPPIEIQTNIPGLNGNGLNLPGVAQAVSQASGGSSSGMPPIFGGSSGGQSSSSQQSPFPMPPSQSQSQGGQQSQSPMSQSQSQQGGQQGQQGQMPQSQSQSTQSSQSSQSQSAQSQQQAGMQGAQSQSPISAQMPPAPEEQAIGDQNAQIDPNGEMAGEGEAGEAGDEGADGGSNESQASQRKSKSAQASANAQDSSEGDGQAMPEDIGGAQGSKRGKGEIDDVAVPTNL